MKQQPHDQDVVRCFLAATSDVQIDALKHIIASLNATLLSPYDIEAGSEIASSIRQQIRGSDCAIIVITKPNPVIFYELGLCKGMGKRTLVISESDADMPLFASETHHLRTLLSDNPILRSGLAGFLQEVRERKKTRRAKRHYPENYARRIRELRHDLPSFNALRASASGQEVEQAVESIFKKLRLTYETSRTTPSVGRVDFALWLDKLSPSLGNPLLVEVKSGDITKERLREARERLSRYAMESNSKACLLLYLDKKGRRYIQHEYGWPLVIEYDLEDFISALARTPLDALILATRNRIAHGS